MRARRRASDRRARRISTRRSRRSRKPTSTRFTASARSCCANARSRPRVDPLFAVLTEPQADRLYERAFARMAAARARRAARRRAPRAAAHERARRSWRRGGGPVDRLRRAGRSSPNGAISTRRGGDRRFDRGAAIERALAAAPRPRATNPAAPSSPRDNLLHRHGCGPPAEPADSSSSVVRATRSRRLGGAARRSRPRRGPLADAEGIGVQVRPGP